LVPDGQPEAMPDKLAPMLAETGDAPFNDADWMWEPKLDGYRVLAYVREHEVQLRSRGGLQLASSFPKLSAALGQQAGATMILDGEIVAFDASGKPPSTLCRTASSSRPSARSPRPTRRRRVALCCFDILHFAGFDLRDAPYRDRQRYLAQCLLPSPLVQLVHAAEDGVALHEAAIASGFEGVIGKRKHSKYQPGRRSPSWLKIKPIMTNEFVIGGYTQGKRIASVARRAAVGILERRQARLRVARRLRFRR
jgi:bifunctional non-homologous end joining protein LigD